MKTLREALFNKKNLDNKSNKYGITKDDMTGDLVGFPVGVVVRMMEEQEAQGNKPDVKVFQRSNTNISVGFAWYKTEKGDDFWYRVISLNNFDLFFKNYPEYEKYN